MGRIKLYNHSRIENKFLYPLLRAAAVAAGVKGPVIVKIGRGGYSGDGEARRADFVKSWYLAKRSHKKAQTKDDRYWGTDLKKGIVKTNCGYAIISPHLIPRYTSSLIFEIFSKANVNGVEKVPGVADAHAGKTGPRSNGQ